MAFNVGNFVKDTAKSAVNKLVDDAVGKISSGLPMNTKLIADSAAKSLFNIGASYESVQALAAAKTDNIISGGADEFFALAGKAVNRTGGVNLKDLRRLGEESLNSYLRNINPTTKIASKRKRDELEILSVL